MMASIDVIFGTASLAAWDETSVIDLYDVLEKHGVNRLDTAQRYGNGTVEPLLGRLTPQNKGFQIDTKWLGGLSDKPNGSSKQIIVSTAKESLEKLKLKQVDVFYMHAPDHQTPLADTLKGVDEVYKSGGFKRFGLSNYNPQDVEKIYNLCKENGYVRPSVYQGLYGPIVRISEDALFPVLRKLRIAFHAYSPMAGGLLTKTKQQVLDGTGRFSADVAGGLFRNLFNRPAFLESLSEWNEIAEEEGCSNAELAYRWVTYHSALQKENDDALIIGASRLEQLAQTLEGLQHGPLSEKAVKRIDKIWQDVKHEVDVKAYMTIGKG